MSKGIGLTLLLASMATLLLVGLQVVRFEYWLSPPKEKFSRSWAEDVRLLEESGQLPAQWKEIREITVKTDNSPAQDWIGNKKAPIQTKSDGLYRLDVFIIHWIEDHRYGVILQYHLVDLSNQNTIWELGRTLKLGFVY